MAAGPVGLEDEEEDEEDEEDEDDDEDDEEEAEFTLQKSGSSSHPNGGVWLSMSPKI